MTIRIEGPIGDPWMDGVSVKDVIAQIKAHPAGEPLEVIINSPGGSAFDGVALYNEFMAHPAKKNVRVRGLAASAASIVAMAGDTVTMETGSMMMIHNAWALTMGDSKAHTQMNEALSKMDEALGDIYSKRTGQTREKVLEMMAAETWMNETDAVSLGFANGAEKEEEAGKAKAESQAPMMARRLPFPAAWRNAPRDFTFGSKALPDGAPKNSGASATPISALKDILSTQEALYHAERHA